MRGVTLATLVTKLKSEIGESLDASATGKDLAFQQLLDNKQAWLASEFDWPFLQHRWDVACGVASRYLTFPTVESDEGATVAINFERPVMVEVKFNERWQKVKYGIGGAEFNSNDSDLNLVLDPVQKWRFATDTSEAANPDQFEIWPMPATGQTLRFTGQRAITPMVVGTNTTTNGANKADLDDMLIVYFVAAELLARADQADSQLKASLAQERMRQVRASYPVQSGRIVLGCESGDDVRHHRNVPMVVVHG